MPRHLTHGALRKQIASRRLDPLYVLLGDDDAAKDRVVSTLVETVEPDLRAFNVERIYLRDMKAEESKAGRIVDAARTLPMLVPQRIIIVGDAEKLAGKDEDESATAPRSEEDNSPSLAQRPAATARSASKAAKAAAAGESDALEAYFRSPSPETALVFVLPGLKEPARRPFKVLFEHASVVLLARQAPADEIREGIENQVRLAGLSIDARAVRLLAERAAGDKSRARIETERACLFAAGRGRVTLEDVEATVGPPASSDSWALVRKLESRAAGEALRELDVLFAKGGLPYMILGQIRSFVEAKMFTKAAVEALLRADLDIKTSTGDPKASLERLIVELVGRDEGKGRKR
ncbi:MAG: DNA polymerase III subunit delta [Vicinamibacterales bacterium]